MDNDRWSPQYFKIESKHYLVLSERRNTRARSTRVILYRRFANSVLFTDQELDGVISPYPHKNIFASKYILADTQSVSESHRQQNNEYFYKAFNLKSWMLFFFYKKIFCTPCIYASQRFDICKDIFLAGLENVPTII